MLEQFTSYVQAYQAGFDHGDPSLNPHLLSSNYSDLYLLGCKAKELKLARDASIHKGSGYKWMVGTHATRMRKFVIIGRSISEQPLESHE